LTLTTVGYGDIVPVTLAGRFAGVAIMFTGIAVLGVLAGSLASLFHLDDAPDEETPAGDSAVAATTHDELLALGAQVREVEHRLGELAERAQAEVTARSQ
jgi:voltage-gated potassium channel